MLKYLLATTISAVCLMTVAPVLLLTNGQINGVEVLLFGWGGVFYGVVSWFWFFGFGFFVACINEKRLLPVVALSLVIFFVLCVITIPFGFTIGMNSPGDPTGSLNAHLSGFSAGIFMFVGLMFYLIAAVATVHFYRFTPTSQKIVAILSITCVSLLILILVSFYNEQPETFFQKGIFFLQNNW